LTDATSGPVADPAAYRQRVRDAIVAALDPFTADPHFIAAFEGGAAATGRADAFSDIDLCVVADRAAAPAIDEALFAAIETALQSVAPITHVWPVADPPWPGLAQRFYFLQDSPRFFAVDCSLMQPVTDEHFLEPERHGTAVPLVDPRGWARPRPLDRAAHDARRRKRLAQNRAAWPVYRMLVDKELARGRTLDALGFYQAMLRLLVELAGLVHRPDRFDFGWRYLHHDLPPALQRDLAQLAYVADPQAMAQRLAQADVLHAALSDALPA
jgi:hypothetical protein